MGAGILPAMRNLPRSILVVCLALGASRPTAAQGAGDAPFLQDIRVAFHLGADAAENDVRALAVGPDGTVLAATRTGVRRVGKGKLTPPAGGDVQGPAYDVLRDGDEMWVAAWNGVFRVRGERLDREPAPGVPIAALFAGEGELLAGGPDGAFARREGTWHPLSGGFSRGIRALARQGEDLWVAATNGLYRVRGDGRTTRDHRTEEIPASEVTGLALAGDRLWIATTAGLDLRVNGERPRERGGPLDPARWPSAKLTAVAVAPRGDLWIGTEIGAARWRFEDHGPWAGWTLRHSKRWLPDDRVRDFAFGPQDTVWIATAGGVAQLRAIPMTLAAKAARFQRVAEARHVRPPGLTERCRLVRPGDVSSFRPMDTDNDGLFTATYLAAQCYRFAVTGDPAAKAAADRAFEAMEFLQTVTGSKGFVARTVIPASWDRMADRNRHYTPQEIAEARVRDPRWKHVSRRWRPSADGKWLWKGDTSSDEISGHYFAYALYFDLVAGAERKARVAALVKRITDYIVEGGFVLRDLDGRATRWGVWSPARLNDDPDWANERGVNSVEILSFLTVAAHVTKDERYRAIAGRLLDEHGYARNILAPCPRDPGAFTYIDQQLLALAYRGLLAYERDPERRALYLRSLRAWFRGVARDASPLYDYVQAAITGTVARPQACLAWLRRVPLDLVHWRIQQSRREDVRLLRRPEAEELQVDRLLPPDERAVHRWDRNPYAVARGDGGHTEHSPAYWLLPYWMGRYHGFVPGRR